MVLDTSLKAYINEIAPTLGSKQIAIVELFERNPEKDFTNSEIARELEWTINRVTGRVKELRDMNMLVESCRRQCLVTGRDVHSWRLNLASLTSRSISQVPSHYQFRLGRYADSRMW